MLPPVARSWWMPPRMDKQWDCVVAELLNNWKLLGHGGQTPTKRGNCFLGALLAFRALVRDAEVGTLMGEEGHGEAEKEEHFG